MKLLHCLAIALCLLPIHHATGELFEFVDDAPKGFVHIRGPGEGNPSDIFVRTDKIASVEIFVQEIDDKPVPSIRIRTVAIRGFGDEVRRLDYYINFKTMLEAKRCATRIMAETVREK